jgi:hypothetical protein
MTTAAASSAATTTAGPIVLGNTSTQCTTSHTHHPVSGLLPGGGRSVATHWERPRRGRQAATRTPPVAPTVATVAPCRPAAR